MWYTAGSITAGLRFRFLVLGIWSSCVSSEISASARAALTFLLLLVISTGFAASTAAAKHSSFTTTLDLTTTLRLFLAGFFAITGSSSDRGESSESLEAG